MNQIVAEVVEKQIKSLKWIYGVMAVTVLATFVVTLVLDPGTDAGADSGILLWTQLGLGVFAALLLSLILPITRARLLNPDRVKNASEEKLSSWGLPKNIDPQIGRQAVYLTRHTAGSVISWGLAAATGLYGLVARMLGSPALVSGLFLAAAVFVLILLPPRGQWLRDTVEKI
jgi:multidrug efflux pump subunit AcrB